MALHHTRRLDSFRRNGGHDLRRVHRSGGSSLHPASDTREYQTDLSAGTAGYSGTPLVRKLGLKAGARIQLVGAPPGFERTLGGFPDDVRPSPRGTLDFALLFARSKAELRKAFPELRDRLETNGMLWVAWPKKAAKLQTDMSESVAREYGLAEGLVDVKICAVDDTWSALKFVRRLRDRQTAARKT